MSECARWEQKHTQHNTGHGHEEREICVGSKRERTYKVGDIATATERAAAERRLPRFCFRQTFPKRCGESPNIGVEGKGREYDIGGGQARHEVNTTGQIEERSTHTIQKRKLLLPNLVQP